MYNNDISYWMTTVELDDFLMNRFTCSALLYFFKIVYGHNNDNIITFSSNWIVASTRSDTVSYNSNAVILSVPQNVCVCVCVCLFS